MNEIKNTLLKKIQSKNAVIGILGMGYVGLPLMLRYIDVGFQVIGFDIDQKKIDTIQAGQSYIEHISATVIQNANNEGMDVTTNFSRINHTDAIILYPVSTSWTDSASLLR